MHGRTICSCKLKFAFISSRSIQSAKVNLDRYGQISAFKSTLFFQISFYQI
ncbi:hypothetical protein CSUNSWCD_413 [Campylobacter showae CSUNSWCD]|uniref:Uncharacterized protein n=1 Tax=Campylobacter showae CSUNSWCD TaxID=1244083 RepID=M5IT97_9BACT|nr:hypothetical protein CSUNSWCD_413 [Campylobacter showae CSUNSWCD]